MHTAVYFFGPNAGAGSNPSGTSIPDTGSTRHHLARRRQRRRFAPSPFLATHAFASSARKSTRASRSAFADDLLARERGSGRLARSCLRALRSSESLKSLSAVAFACALVSRRSFHLDGEVLVVRGEPALCTDPAGAVAPMKPPGTRPAWATTRWPFATPPMRPAGAVLLSSSDLPGWGRRGEAGVRIFPD